jgi:hypothetical protein
MEGFTVKNGMASEGGGFHLSGASPTLRDLVVEDNEASSRGGGLALLDASSPDVSDVTIRGNIATG